MNTLLISPWFIYFLGLLPILRGVLMFLSLGFLTLFLVFAITWKSDEGGYKYYFDYFTNCVRIIKNSEGKEDIKLDSYYENYLKREIETIKKYKKKIYIFGSLSLAFGLLAVFMPSKETVIAMEIAKLATAENIMWTVDQLKNIVDYITESIARIAGSL